MKGTSPVAGPTASRTGAAVPPERPRPQRLCSVADVSDDTRISSLRAASAAQDATTRADLEALVRIPSVSARAFDAGHVHASAAAVADLLRGAGMPRVDVVTARAGDLESHPAVIARRPAPAGAPTVLLYAHHDVQPPGRDGDWSSPPFEPTERDGRLFGRGAADDKAGVMAHVHALRTLLPTWGPDEGVGVTVFVEGEEEIGSPTFAAFLTEHREALAADVIVVADSGNWRVGVPALTTTLRGLVDCDVTVDVLSHAVHSGVNGGPVLDALTSLARLLATLHDENGDVAVDGLVRGHAPLVDLDEATFRADAGVLPEVRLAGTGTIADRLWTKPAIAVTGLDATPVDLVSNTLIPSARAKISMRLAPGQDPAAAMTALRRHLLANAPFGARVRVDDGDEGQAFSADTSTRAYEVARAALTEAFGAETVEMGMGGSIPFIADLSAVYPRAAILVTGVEDPDSRAHGADESLHLADFARACLGEVLLLDGLSRES
ncbi:acetylornithine deacetylase/succinyl-diaminopimelate desuccinylase-like protein [Kineococcus rhizosphaerae]|uniref:Acetylornithine deacetylase/succinyl-diaminopimelate desuccinylase-like protein n=1 Tax=Kineococcus rhizosphaerae TaxID=559628 RepID=A0A2T0R8N8_9ACTN|nr:acetylornithine deacetylase/succinyl-diaminopimelate desuccinylase-like protein [Kineococcus rhizosphaerae]